VLKSYTRNTVTGRKGYFMFETTKIFQFRLNYKKKWSSKDKCMLLVTSDVCFSL